MSPGATAPVIEIVTYRSALDAAAFLATVPPTMEFLRARPGFRGRQLAQADDGQWADVVQWASMAEALDAAARFNASPLTAAFNAAISPGTVVMRHYSVAAAI
jgi:hypothetical protein